MLPMHIAAPEDYPTAGHDLRPGLHTTPPTAYHPAPLRSGVFGFRYFAERSLAVVFNAWHQHMVRRKQREAAMVKCSRRRSTLQMAACLAAWRAQVEVLAEAKAVAARCLQRCMHNSLVRNTMQSLGCGFVVASH